MKSQVKIALLAAPALLVLLIVYATGQQLQVYFPGSDHRNAIFANHGNTILDVPPFLRKMVANLMECALSCLKHVPCLSFNMAVKPIENKHDCHLLDTDKYSSSENLKSSKDFSHHSIMSPCESVPCQNGGTCLPIYEKLKYKCLCAASFVGMHCDSRDSCQPIGVQDVNKIPDGNMTATSQYSVKYLPQYGRLHGERGKGAWCPNKHHANDYLQIDLGTEQAVCAVATQGERADDEWITLYKLETSRDGANWSFYKENNTDKEFSGNNDTDTVVKRSLPLDINARYVRFYPVAFQRHPSIRVEIYVRK